MEIRDEPVWFNALTLGERAASLLIAGNRPSFDTAPHRELAEKRILRWRSAPPFDDQGCFEKRLAVDSIDESQLRRLLAESAESLRSRVPRTPDWINQIGLAFSTPSHTGSNGSQKPSADRLQKLGFLVGVEPLVKLGLDRLQMGVDSIHRQFEKVPFDPAAVGQLMLAGLPAQLMKLMGRAMVLELNVARMSGLLSGDTPEVRYLNFLENLTQPAAMLSILKEYPVLARHIVTCIDRWVETSLEFLLRLSSDWEIICAGLNGGADPGELSLVSPAAGDLHRGGRSVIVARFGKDWKLVYKPHSLAVDRHFSVLLTRLNEWGDHPPFHAPVVLDRGAYGWSEYVEARACNTADEAARFYQRQGGFLALLYFLEATDFHLENLIACGEHPILVDLEALFHPRLGLLMSRSQSARLAEDVMARSVLRVGLLPQRIWAGEGKPGIDISGLGGEPGQLSPHLVPAFDRAGSDEMRVVRKQVPLPASQNRPTIDGSPLNPLQFVDCIVDGFSSIYKLIIERRDELLAADGPIRAFAADEVRVVVRPTRTYALLLSESSHPDVLKLGFEQDRLFDRLWMDISTRPDMAHLIPAETEDLRRGDVPVFTTKPSSRDIWTSTGVHTPDFFEASSLSAAQQRIAEANDSDLSRQTWFIRASLASLTVGHDHNARATAPSRAEFGPATPDDFISAAITVADRLEMLAIEQQDEVAWIGLVLADESSWSLLPLSFDLYGGTLGILFFLGYLGAIAHQERYTRLAQKALQSVLKSLDAAQRSAPPGSLAGNISAFSGWGGVIYTLAHMGTLWGDRDLIARAEALIEVAAARIEQDRGLDVINGAAGLIAVLCGFHRLTGFGPAFKAAKDCADHLIASARPMDNGIAWETPVRSTQPLTGFSHGAAGFSWALQEIASLSGEQRYKRAALDAAAYERSVFSTEAANWPDFRSDGAKTRTRPAFSMTWCHGAPGIALGRLASLRRFEDSEIRADAEIALETTLRAGFGMNQSLCHGDLGNLEPFLIAGQSESGARWKTYAPAIGSSVLDRIRTNGWMCGVPQGVETPGLLVGLAGIGYGLLRLADPSFIPSILTLAPPACAETEKGNVL